MARKIKKDVMFTGRITINQLVKLREHLRKKDKTASQWLREKIEGIRG